MPSMLLSVSFPETDSKANKPSIHKRLAAYRAMMPKKTKDKVKEPASGAEPMKRKSVNSDAEVEE